MRIVKPADERKEEILDVAEQLFAEKGIAPQPHARILYSYAEQTEQFAHDL